uniref:Large ribosomal subunit protein eL22 n=1 Tax=Lynx canadensis TaxID=61383 RepID=A0A667FTY8_LYNCA
MAAANVEQFFGERIKVNGKAGNLGEGAVYLERSKSKTTLTPEVTFSKKSSKLGGCDILAASNHLPYYEPGEKTCLQNEIRDEKQ